MSLKPNKIRDKLRKGETVFGSGLLSSSPNVMEAACHSGIEFMRVDTEHTWRRDAVADHIMRVAALTDVVALMRVDFDAALIRKALEIGAGGVIVPHICTIAEAETVVAAAKFPPRGTRGFSTGCFSARWGSVNPAEWKTWSDTEPMIGIMIEDIKSMDCLDGIMAVDGIDFVVFGPGDYAISLGLGGPKKDHPDVQAGLIRTIEAAKKAGKNVMYCVNPDPAAIRKHMDMGVDMIEISEDLNLVRLTLANAIKNAKLT
jgi:4-hydroxy-2-oxoheptanedioate aldolase